MIESMYKAQSPDYIDNLLSQFLINSWSYSKVTTFSRNEKAFEMQYIYGEKSKLSATTIAGQAYHKALQGFFNALKAKETPLQLADLEVIAYEYIDEVEATIWKLQKTTPTIAECRAKANQTVTALLKNFYSELSTYLDQVEEVMEVELVGSEFVVINGVDIPLPCNFVIDLVVRLKDGRHAIIDHKSKDKFSTEEEMKLAVGVQAVTYLKNYEAMTGLTVDEVWFVQNKYSQNRDKTPQLNAFVIQMDENTIRLYEHLLYEPLKRMLEAVNNPDHVYLINDSDNFVDKAELYAFWCKTQISEIEDFNVDPSKRELVERRLKKIRDTSIKTINPSVIKKFRQNAAEFIQYDLSNTNMTQEEKIEHVLRSFGTIVRVAHKFEGYSSSTYLLEVSAGVKVTSIQSNRLDIANALNVANVRIARELYVHEGRSYVPVEFAKRREHSLLFEPADLKGQKIPIGKDNFGSVVHWDLENHSTPHALICGATGSGKSVCIRSIIEYAKLAGIKNIVILDPKFEFTEYSGNGIEVYNDILDIEAAMELLVEDMNNKVKRGETSKTLVIFDEFADALAQARKGKELEIWEDEVVGYYKLSMAAILAGAEPQPKYKKVKKGENKPLEENMRVLVQKGRSVGFRVVAATQRASTKVITGDAKANFPVQICFRVPKEVDSRVVLDEAGAEALTGMGDGLIKSPEYTDTVRFQAYFKP